jgi:CDP-diglyceride synthetase
MTITTTSDFLRRALLVDAAITGATAVMLVAGAPILQDLLGLQPALLRGAGLSLIPFTALLLYLLRADPLPRGAVWFVVACNAIWALDSIALLFTGWVDPTGIGQAFVVFQALVVAGFAEMQYLGLRRSRAN